MSRRSQYYDEDDFDDGYSDDDEDWWGEEEDAHDAPAQTQTPPKIQQAARQTTASKPATSATTKPKTSGKNLPQAAAIQNKSFPLVPRGTNGTAEHDELKPFAFDTPSPDDVVLAAQQGSNKATTSTTAAAATAAAAAASSSSLRKAPADTVAHGISNLDLNRNGNAASAPPASVPLHSKPLAQYTPEADLQQACQQALAAEQGSGGKARLHLVVLGHVDAGKSTLMGRLLYELGNIAEKHVHKTKKEAAAAGKASFAWAWMLDERPEERARGVTVDVAMNRFETATRLVTLLDAPGHRDFVPNMIAGTSQADAALIVVDGSPGGFEAGFDPVTSGSGGGQTREHAQLARSLGVEQAAIVITKLDTCNFDQARFQHIKGQMEPFLKTCGFKASSLQWLPAIGPSGLNLTEPPTAEPALASWWTGPTLVQAIDAFTPAHRLLERPLRLPVTEAGAKSGKGAVSVGGKMEGGALRPGTKVIILPAKEVATVKALEVDGKAASLAMAGDSVEITVTGIEANMLGAGSVICHPDYPTPLAKKLEARIVVLDVAIPMLKGQQVTLHSHAAREPGHISGLISLLDSKSGEVAKTRPRCILKGQSAVVEITPARPMCLETYADYKALGRVALRDGGRTIAVGIVTAIHS